MKGIIISFVIGICSFFLSQSAWGQAVGKLPEGDFDSWPARFHKKVLIDSISRLECIYDFTEIDTLLERMNEHRLILQVGEKATFVQDYNSYFTDSIFRSRNYELRNGEVFEILGKNRRSYKATFAREGKIYYCNTYIWMDPMEYADSTVHFNWQLHPDTLMVCGYLCRKATATFRGVDWTVWYAEDLPFDAGPWKFNGLPGLVLKAIDGTSTHLYEAIVVRKPHIPLIDRDRQAMLTKCTRERFREVLYNYVTNSTAVINASGLLELPETTPQREFYSPQELE